MFSFPPLLSAQAVGLQRVCQGAVEQFVDMKFEGPLERELQRRQINQSVWKVRTMPCLIWPGLLECVLRLCKP